MEQQIFTNESILSWLQYFAKNTAIDLEKVKMLDITRKNKNLIPTVESHRAVLVFTEAGIADIFLIILANNEFERRNINLSSTIAEMNHNVH